MWNIYFNPVVLGPNYSDQGYAKKTVNYFQKKFHQMGQDIQEWIK